MKKWMLALLSAACMAVGAQSSVQSAFAAAVELTEIADEPEEAAGEPEEIAVETEESEVEPTEIEAGTEESEVEPQTYPTGLMEMEIIDEGVIPESELPDAASDGADSIFSVRESQAYDSSEWDKYSSNYYYNQLSEAEKEYWDAMDAVCLKYLTGTQNAETSSKGYRTEWITIGDTDSSRLFTVAKIFRFSNPQYYFLNTTRYSASSETTGNVYVAFGIYSAFADGSSRKTATAQVKTQAETWVNQVLIYDTEAEKVKAIHDLVVDNVEYDYDIVTGGITSEEEDAAYSQSVYSVLCTDLTVCAGYAQTFEMLCNAAGVDSVAATSATHEWNKVRVNDSWYNIDCTWADTGSGNAINYVNYLRNDSYFHQASAHIEEDFWEGVLPTCSLDAGSTSNAPGTLPVIGQTTDAPEISVVWKNDSYQVTITDATQGADIYYTTDGKEPAPAATKSIKYTGSFVTDSPRSVKAVAVCDTYWDSEIASFEREGYTFEDWCIDAECTTSVTEIPQGSTDYFTLYAKWTPNQYTIRFDGNSSTSGSLSDMTPCTYDESYALPANTFVRTGYSFSGWNTSADGSGNSYDDQETIKNLSAKSGEVVTLYAKWTPNQYTIRFDGNSSTSGSMDSLTNCSYDTEYKLTANAYKKKGYTFNGWNTKADGSGKSYSNKAGVKNLSAKSGGSVTLYAQWKKNTYTITYNLDSGKNNSKNPASYTVTTATITFNEPTRTGYTFGGWYTDAKFKNKITKLAKGSTGNKTLYAKWTANKYTIKFNGNGSTKGSMKSQNNCSYGTSYKLTANAYKRTGYTFNGWNTKADGSGKSYSNKASVKNLSAKSGGSVTLYAQWKKTSYTITYKLNGGKNNSKNPSSYKITTATITLKNPTRSGYQFEGWYTDSKYKNKITKIAKGSTGNKTLYAKWKKK